MIDWVCPRIGNTQVTTDGDVYVMLQDFQLNSPLRFISPAKELFDITKELSGNSLAEADITTKLESMKRAPYKSMEGGSLFEELHAAESNPFGLEISFFNKESMTGPYAGMKIMELLKAGVGPFTQLTGSVGTTNVTSASFSVNDGFKRNLPAGTAGTGNSVAIGDASVNTIRIAKPAKILLVEILPVAGPEITVAAHQARVFQMASIAGNAAGTQRLADMLLEAFDSFAFTTPMRPTLTLVMNIT